MSLHYITQEPKIKTDNPKAYILLHGYGSNEEDLFSFAPQLPEDAYIFSVRAPFDAPPYGFAWYAINFDADQNKFSDNEQAKDSVQLIGSFIDEISSKYEIKFKNIMLIGFSQGCILSYAVSLTFPEKIKGIVAMGGYLNEQIIPTTIDKNAISHLKIFSSHGTQDQVVPVDWARKAKPFLENLGVNVIYKEYPVGHGIPPQNFWDFRNWLDEI
jgi:phospholipase/carboxylesterase